jgi:transposase
VPLKSREQLDLQALHRVRQRLVGERTAVINQVRGFLLEHGITVRAGPPALRRALPEILADQRGALSPGMAQLLLGLDGDWRRLDERIGEVTRTIEEIAKRDEGCRRRMAVPGIGPVVASAMVAAIGDGAAFTKARGFGAWLGLVPKQVSTGDRTLLLGISERGNRYLGCRHRTGRIARSAARTGNVRQGSRIARRSDPYRSPKARRARPTQSSSSARVRPQERASGGVPQRNAKKPMAQAALPRRMRLRSRCDPTAGS